MAAVPRALALVFTLAVALPFAAPAPARADDPGFAFHGALPIPRARLGVEVLDLTPELREHFGAPADRGVLVARVASGSAAERAGLQVGDVVVRVGDRPVESPWDLIRGVAAVPAGEELALEVLRGAATVPLRAAPEGDAVPWLEPGRVEEWVGRGLREGGERLRERLDALERRLDELERRLENDPDAGPGRAT